METVGRAGIALLAVFAVAAAAERTNARAGAGDVNAVLDIAAGCYAPSGNEQWACFSALGGIGDATALRVLIERLNDDVPPPADGDQIFHSPRGTALLTLSKAAPEAGVVVDIRNLYTQEGRAAAAEAFRKHFNGAFKDDADLERAFVRAMDQRDARAVLVLRRIAAPALAAKIDAAPKIEAGVKWEVKRRSLPASAKFLNLDVDGIVARAASLPQVGPSAAGVAEATAALKRCLARATQLHPGDAYGAVTQISDDHDTLLAAFPFDGDDRLVVKDAGSGMTVLMPMEQSTWKTAADVRRMLETTVNFAAFPRDLAITLTIDPRHHRFAAQGVTYYSAIPHVFSMQTIELRGRHYLAWLCSKLFFRDIFDPHRLDDAERFPPLGDRIRGASKEQLLPMIATPASPLSSRDEVVLLELLRGGLSGTELERLLTPARRAVQLADMAMRDEDPALFRALLNQFRDAGALDFVGPACRALEEPRFADAAREYLARRPNGADCVR